MDLIFERAALEHLDVLLDLYAQLHPEDPRLDPHIAVETWKLILAYPGRETLLAWHAGTPVGTADYWVVPNLTRGAKSYVIIENVVVDSDYRSLGVGSAILAEIERRVSGVEIYKIQLQVGLQGPLYFYFRQGFTLEGLTLKRKN